jgi:Helicase associated domain
MASRSRRSYTVEGYELGKWVRTQRRFHFEGRLDADRERRLQGLPGWTWKARSSTEASGVAGRSSSIMPRRQRPATR